MMTLSEAKEVLRIDASNTANDDLIISLLGAIPSYIELTTGMPIEEQNSDGLAITVSGFLLKLWYFADHAEEQKLQRTIDNLLKCITLKARA